MTLFACSRAVLSGFPGMQLCFCCRSGVCETLGGLQEQRDEKVPQSHLHHHRVTLVITSPHRQVTSRLSLLSPRSSVGQDFSGVVGTAHCPGLLSTLFAIRLQAQKFCVSTAG